MAMANESKPLSAQELKFATMYGRYRDIYKAAERAHVPRNQAVRMFNKPAVQDEIDRNMDVLRAERAKQQVQDEGLTNQLLDAELVGVIRSGKVSDSLKLEAIRLGYVATGRIQAGNTKLLEAPEGGGAAGANVPSLYSPFIPVGMPVRPVMPTEGIGNREQGTENLPPAEADSKTPENIRNVQITEDVKTQPPAVGPTSPAPAAPAKPRQHAPFGRKPSGKMIELG